MDAALAPFADRRHSTQGGPRYNKAGELIAPSDYREKVFLSSGLSMNCGVNARTGDDDFDNVFVDPV